MVKKCLLLPAVVFFATLALSLSSCKDEEDEPMWDGNIRMVSVKISVIGEEGGDLVEEWYKTDNENKCSDVEYTWNPKYSEVTTEKVLFDLSNTQTKKCHFWFCQVFSHVEIGNTMFWRFKMYKTDVEEILIEGVCNKVKPYKDTSGQKIDRNIQWSFRGVNLNAVDKESSTSITLVRTKDGRYTLKQ